MSIMGWGKRKNIKMIFKYLLILAGLFMVYTGSQKYRFAGLFIFRPKHSCGNKA